MSKRNKIKLSVEVYLHPITKKRYVKIDDLINWMKVQPNNEGMSEKLCEALVEELENMNNEKLTL